MRTSGQILMDKILNKSEWEDELPPEIIMKNMIENFGIKCQKHELQILKFIIEENKAEREFIHKVIVELINKSVNQWDFAKTAVELVLHMQSVCEESIAVKNHYIVTLQSTYEACEGRNSTDANSWFGCVSLLVHTSVLMVLKGGIPIQALLEKARDGLKSLLVTAGTQNEIDCCCHLLNACWDTMLAHQKEGFLSMIPLIKEIVISSRGSPTSRSHLIDKLTSLKSLAQKH